MYLIWFVLFWMIGMAVTSYTALVVMIILNFGIPITRRLEKMGLLKPNPIIKSYRLTILVLSAVFLLVGVLVHRFAPTGGFAGLVCGSIVILFFGAGKTGVNSNNMSDYIEVNRRHFQKNDEEIVAAILK